VEGLSQEQAQFTAPWIHLTTFSIFWNALKSRPPWPFHRLIHELRQNLFHSQLPQLYLTNQLLQLFLRHLYLNLPRRFPTTAERTLLRRKILLLLGGVPFAPYAIPHFLGLERNIQSKRLVL